MSQSQYNLHAAAGCRDDGWPDRVDPFDVVWADENFLTLSLVAQPPLGGACPHDLLAHLAHAKPAALELDIRLPSPVRALARLARRLASALTDRPAARQHRDEASCEASGWKRDELSASGRAGLT